MLKIKRVIAGALIMAMLAGGISENVLAEDVQNDLEAVQTEQSENVSEAETEPEETESEEIESEEIESEETASEETESEETEQESPVDIFGDEDPETLLEMIGRPGVYDDNDISLMTSSSKVVKAMGIDVSCHNNESNGTPQVIDWDKAKAAGVDFVIVRVGYRGYGTGKLMTDDYAVQNIEGALDAGLDVGVYFFSTALNETEAVEEAKYTYNIIKKYDLTYPVAYDCELYNTSYSRDYGLSIAQRTKNAIAFLDYMESKGYTGLMYGSASSFRNENDWDTSVLQDKYDIWVAQYPYSITSLATGKTLQTSYEGEYAIWQFSASGSIDGVPGRADMNVEYTDLADLMVGASASVPGTTLSSVANAADGVKVTWNLSSTATGYELYRSVNDSDYTLCKSVDDPTVSSCTDTDVTSGNTYSYRIACTNSKGTSTLSRAKEITYLSAPVLTGAVNSAGGIKVQWQKVAGAEKYYIYRKEVSGKYSLVGSVTGANSLYFTDKKAVNDKDYVYTVRAMADGVLGSFESTASVHCIGCVPLNSIVTTSAGVWISFSQIDDVDAYYIYRKVKGGTYSIIATVAQGKTTYTDRKAVSGTDYIYTIRAVKDGVKGCLDSTLETYYLSAPNLVYASYNGSFTTVNWQTVAGASGYYIYRKTSAGKWSRAGSVSGSGVTTWTDKNVSSTSATGYIYTVRAYYGEALSSFQTSGVQTVKKTTTLTCKNYTTTQELNYRTGPGTSYSTAGRLAAGCQVRVVSGYSKSANGYTWYKIFLNGKYYYVASGYLKS